MTTARAHLAVEQRAGRTRAIRAAATAPQRWSVPASDACGRLQVTHQLLGDGVFGGDVHRTSISAGPGTSLLVRAVAATPLRGPSPSATLTRLRVSRDATLVYLPGALVPHRGSDSRSVLRIEAAEGARVVAASIVAPGRLAMGESSAFRDLQLRTVVRYGGRLVLAQHQSIGPASLATPDLFEGAATCLSIICIGPWAPACLDWWSLLPAAPGITGGATRLRTDGVAYFATAQSLGAAQRLLGEVTSRLS